MDTKDQKRGQAVIEFVISLVVLMVLFAGILQGISLSRARTETMIQARRSAGSAALQQVGVLPVPHYIGQWQVGPDETRYTRDDTFTPADPTAFQQTVINAAVAQPADWQVLEQAPTRHLHRLRIHPSPVAYFGMVREVQTETVPLFSATQRLLYNATEIEIESEVWMTWTHGLY